MRKILYAVTNNKDERKKLKCPVPTDKCNAHNGTSRFGTAKPPNSCEYTHDGGIDYADVIKDLRNQGGDPTNAKLIEELRKKVSA
jgi:hypothetical protein